MTHVDPPVSDNAETREALRAEIVAVLHAEHCADHYDHDGYSVEDYSLADVIMALPVLAALPPVAGPEVRPDETLRAAMASDLRGVGNWLVREADQRIRFFPQRKDGVDDLMRALAADLFVRALAAPAPAPGDEGLRRPDGEHAHGCRLLYPHDAPHHCRPAPAPGDDETLRVCDHCGARLRPDPDAWVDEHGFRRCAIGRDHQPAALTPPAPAATEVGEGER